MGLGVLPQRENSGARKAARDGGEKLESSREIARENWQRKLRTNSSSQLRSELNTKSRGENTAAHMR
jgi:hypothetical protein